jgi:hypothetical protein
MPAESEQPALQLDRSRDNNDVKRAGQTHLCILELSCRMLPPDPQDLLIFRVKSSATFPESGFTCRDAALGGEPAGDG